MRVFQRSLRHSPHSRRNWSSGTDVIDNVRSSSTKRIELIRRYVFAATFRLKAELRNIY